MRRQVLVGIAVGLIAVLGGGLLIWAGSQGLLSPQGPARRLLNAAQRAVQRGDLPGAQAKLEELIASQPSAPEAAEALFQLGQVQEKQQKLLEARAAYRQLLDQFPGSPVAAQAQAGLGAVNVALLFSRQLTEADATYDVAPGDSLGKIAASHNTTVEYLKQANALSSDMIRPNQRLKVPKGRFSIVVDKSQNQLLLTQNNQFFKIYPVATGKDNSTPVGTFRILNKLAKPVWYTQGAVVPPDSPDNILGSRWLGLDKPGYGIHGSVDATGIGHQVTAGCVRMHNSDVEELFTIVPVDTPVTIMD
jgi:lipoprotein-anchoring transpeptidase ErfK/SrfK